MRKGSDEQDKHARRWFTSEQRKDETIRLHGPASQPETMLRTLCVEGRERKQHCTEDAILWQTPGKDGSADGCVTVPAAN
jgi:hypothetical protein